MRSILLSAFASLILLACGGSASPPPAMLPPGYQPAPPPPLAPGETLHYKLPIVGAWWVQRTHYGARNDQAYAIDIVFGATLADVHHGDVNRNENWAAYNQPIVADAPGVVAVAVDGHPENVVGEVDNYDAHGNYIVIDHGNGQFSMFCHLIPYSQKVRPGQQVQTGQELARCGNSGRSTNPHLHWQVMDAPNPQHAHALVPQLYPYLRNGQQSVEMPQAHDTIQNL